jgi:hypothetical protein
MVLNVFIIGYNLFVNISAFYDGYVLKFAIKCGGLYFATDLIQFMFIWNLLCKQRAFSVRACVTVVDIILNTHVYRYKRNVGRQRCSYIIREGEAYERTSSHCSEH